MGVPFKSWDSIICCISRMNECWFFACSYIMASGKLKVTLGICIWSDIIWSNYLNFFGNLSIFWSILPAPRIGLKSPDFFKKKKKKIALQENISYYEILFYFMFLTLSFQFSQNNKHKITKETCNSFRCLPLKYFSLFIYNNCITLHLTWLV